MIQKGYGHKEMNNEQTIEIKMLIDLILALQVVHGVHSLGMRHLLVFHAER